VDEMSEKEKDGHMTMKMSHSGDGCNMVTPNGKKNVYCNLHRLVEFCEGLADSVPFTVSVRTETEQSTFNGRIDEELNC
jgi:hypothetical protein